MPECKLCTEDRELRNSHVIPRFVFRWMKKTGPTPFLRRHVDPDTRVQDYHEKMLCEDCEQILSDAEGKFASHIFYPHVRNQPDSFEYGRWLYRFVLSVSWRLLVSEMAAWSEHEQSKVETIEERIEIWRGILTGEKPLSEDPSNHHIFFLDEPDLVASDAEAPDKFEIYMQRALDGTSIYGNDGIHVYFKLPKILFFSTISPRDPGGFIGTEILEEGVIEQPQELGPQWGGFLHNRIEKVNHVSMSDHEWEKVEDRILDDPERYLESEFFEAQIAEMRRKWAEHDLLDHLDEDQCSVCSTNHRVFESLPKRPFTKSDVEQLNQRVLFANATFPREDEIVEEIPLNITDVLIISTDSATRILQLYMNHGWIVGEEIEHHGDVNPVEIGEAAWQKYSEDFHRQMRRQYGRSDSNNIDS